MKLSLKAVGVIAAAALVLGATGGALASGLARQVTASLDPGVKIVYQNQTQSMKDASGNAVYPLIYNGTTYVPIRAVSAIFGQAVDWDPATETVYLGSRARYHLTDLLTAGNQYCWKLREPDELTAAGASTTYTGGIARDIWNGSSSSSAFTLAPIDVTGMSVLTFTGWSDIDANLLVLDENGGIIASIPVTANTPVYKEIDIAGQGKIALGANAQKVGVNGVARFYDPVVQ